MNFNDFEIWLLTLAKKGLNPLGIDVMRYPNRHIINRITLMKNYGINLIFDIGANTGQYVHEIRRAGYTGDIMSFEPLKEAFLRLRHNSKNDPGWEVYNFALGNLNGDIEINVSENLVSSSILPILKQTVDANPETNYIGKERVKMRRLDSIEQTNKIGNKNLFVKIDVQGFEKQVIEGAEGLMNKITGLQLEMSLFPVYDNSVLMWEVVDLLQERGFTLMSVEPGFCDRSTGRLLQMDGIFFRS